MSESIILACISCRMGIWVAQRPYGQKHATGEEAQRFRTFYSGEAPTMRVLTDFLFAHEDHTLCFQAERDGIDEVRTDDSETRACPRSDCVFDADDPHTCRRIDGSLL